MKTLKYVVQQFSGDSLTLQVSWNIETSQSWTRKDFITWIALPSSIKNSIFVSIQTLHHYADYMDRIKGTNLKAIQPPN